MLEKERSFIERLRPLFKRILKPRVLIPAFLILTVVATGLFFYIRRQRRAGVSYASGYRLVNEKISRSAPISVHLPDGTDKEKAKNNITFSPEIEGRWIDSKKEELKFKPSKQLTLNHYYAAELALDQPEGAVIKADFLVVEDPEIAAVFPKDGTEASEYSEITIVFNRPMVPLSTLSLMEPEEVPVEITPKTEGRFKWTDTKTLQFIPEERLTRSSHYKVRIKPGLVSMDGLQVKGKKVEFETRNLRYKKVHHGKTIYNQPLVLRFNQPVNLEKTANRMKLKDLQTGKNVSFVVECQKEEGSFIKRNILGVLKAYNSFLATVADLNPRLSFLERLRSRGTPCSTLEVYNEKDRFGRRKLWDFDRHYQLSVEKVFPAEGDIVVDQKRTAVISVTSPVKDWSAESEYTSYATPSFFDPAGKLWIEFYEEIDLNRSQFSIPKKDDIGYGEKCETEEGVVESSSCHRVEDKKRIYITFREEEVGLGEEMEVRLERIVTEEGLTLNQEPISQRIVSYPEFKIFSASPPPGKESASLRGITLCSNSPILRPQREDYSDFFKANLDHEIQRWGSSYRVRRASKNEVCEVGEFHTRIGYGLMPLSEYRLTLNLKDVFGQEVDYSTQFKTEEMPSRYLMFYHFQPGYNVTPPEKTKLTYAVQNMNYVDVEVCKTSPLQFLYFIGDKPSPYSAFPSSRCEQTVRDRIELPEKYWIKNYFHFRVGDYFEDPTGHYVITFSHPQYKTLYGKEKSVYERTFLTVTDLSVAAKRINPRRISPGDQAIPSPESFKEIKNLFLVTDISSLEPIPGAKVSLYRKTGSNPLSLQISSTGITDQEGVSHSDMIYNLWGAVVSKEGDSTVIPYFQSNLNYSATAATARRAYLYTDKPIYQPGQKIHLKGIYRLGYDGTYEVYRGRDITVTAHNSKGEEFLNREMEVSEFGTFTTNLTLDQDSPLGRYRLCAEGINCIYVDVEKYTPAPFKVEMKPEQEEYISKDTVKMDLSAEYYFGVPLQGGEVEYTVSSQNYHFDRYQDPDFMFGKGWYYWPPYSFGEKFLLRGKVDLDQKGQAEIAHSLDIEKMFEDEEDRKSKIIVVNATVKNNQGQSVSSQHSFILHKGEFYLGLKLDNPFLRKGEETNLYVKSVDTNGDPTRVRNGKVRVFSVEWVYSKRLEASGGYDYKWEKKKELVKEFDFSTNRGGDYSRHLSLEKEGQYELEVEAKDGRGNMVRTTRNIYVHGTNQASIRPSTDTSLSLESEKTDLKVGEEGKLVIKSPYEKAKALIAIERGKVFEYEVKEIKGSISTYTFNVKEEYAPNVFVSVLLISDKPEIKFGAKEFQVDTEQKELDVKISSDKEYYLPGEEVNLNIETRDWQGNPRSSEVSVAVVDLSVLALKGNPKKNPLIFFYHGFPLAVSTSSNIKNILVEQDIPETKGGGGAQAPEGELALKKRGVFKETALWEAEVKTDENGRASLSFTLPDNLTTWQVEGLGVTKDLKLGTDYQDFTTRKKLMVVPLKPRFVVPGDTFLLGGQIFNQSGSRKRIEVSLESETLQLQEKGQKTIRVQDENMKPLYFKVEAPAGMEEGSHHFVISAKTDGLEDTVEQKIQITPNRTYEVTATSNYTRGEVSREYVFLPEEIIKEKGDLTVRSSATLAVFLSDALNDLLQFPYGCTEQVASRLNAIAVVKRGLDIPNLGEKLDLKKIEYEGEELTMEEAVDKGLATIYNNQNSDGGFSYWRRGRSNFFLSLHVIRVLQNLSQAGFEINQASLDRGADYVYREITTDPILYRNKNNVIVASHVLLDLPGFEKKEALRRNIVQITQDEAFIREEISNTSLSYLALILSDGFDQRLKNKIFDELDSRMEIDARGAFLESNNNVMWQYYETSIKNTALYVKAQSRDQREWPLMDKTIRWLLASRSKNGAWGSTNNSLTVIDAFTEFLLWQEETESHFQLDLLVNEENKGGYEFNAETILDQFKKVMDLKELKFNAINTIKFVKKNLNQATNRLYYDLALKYYLPLKNLPPRNEGFGIERTIYSQKDLENEKALSRAEVGDVLRVHLKITVPDTRRYVMVEDLVPAGTEIINLELATEQKSLSLQELEVENRNLYPDFKEMHHDRAFLYKEHLAPGVYEFDYWIRALIPGEFKHLPARVSEMYFPENFGRTTGGIFKID